MADRGENCLIAVAGQPTTVTNSTIAGIIEEAGNGMHIADIFGATDGLPGLPDSQADVGGWEKYPEERRAVDWDTDGDGISDAWEKAHGLDPKDPKDGAVFRKDSGYTNLEVYLNSLVGESSSP